MSIVEISCPEVWREVSNYLEGEISPELRRRMEEHFKVCNHCLAVLDGAKNIIKLYAGGEMFEVPKGFGDRLRRFIKTHETDEGLK